MDKQIIGELKEKTVADLMMFFTINMLKMALQKSPRNDEEGKAFTQEILKEATQQASEMVDCFLATVEAGQIPKKEKVA